MRRSGRVIKGRQSLIAALVSAVVALALRPCAVVSAADPTLADSAAAAPLYEPAGSPMAAPPSDPPADDSAATPVSDVVPLPPASSSTSSSAAAAASSAVPPSGAPMAGTVMVPDSMPAPAYVKSGAAIAPSTTEIPRAAAGQTGDPGNFVSGQNASEVVEYQPQNGMAQPQLRSLQEFISEGDSTSPLGMELREDRRKLRTGRQVEGLLIVGVTNGSPAAAAGLHANKHILHDVVEGGVAMGALFFPPAIMVVAGLEQIPFGESYDMIIGVDGVRVTNFLDFEDQMRDVQPGEIVYLSIVRDGNRVQVPVQLPRTMPPPVF